MAQQNQVARIDDNAVSAYLQQVSPTLGKYARDIDTNSFIGSAMLLISEKPELQQCLQNNQGKRSLLHALKFGASTGLSLNPQEGKAAIIAYGGKVQYQVMKNGLMELAERSGKVKYITADTVRAGDDWSIYKTMAGDEYRFSPARKDRGEIDGFFAAIVLTDGTCHVKYMTREEVEAHRDAYSAMYRAKPSASPWSSSFEGMGQKTVIKALFRNLSVSDDIDRVTESDETYDFSAPAELTQAEEVKQALEAPKEESKSEPEHKKEPKTKQEETKPKNKDLF